MKLFIPALSFHFALGNTVAAVVGRLLGARRTPNHTEYIQID